MPIIISPDIQIAFIGMYTPVIIDVGRLNPNKPPVSIGFNLRIKSVKNIISLK